jgi:hypothetical protein
MWFVLIVAAFAVAAPRGSTTVTPATVAGRPVMVEPVASIAPVRVPPEMVHPLQTSATLKSPSANANNGSSNMTESIFFITTP